MYEGPNKNTFAITSMVIHGMYHTTHGVLFRNPLSPPRGEDGMEGLDLRSGNNLFMEPLDDRGVVEDRYRDRGGVSVSATGDGFADEAAR